MVPQVLIISCMPIKLAFVRFEFHALSTVVGLPHKDIITARSKLRKVLFLELSVTFCFLPRDAAMLARSWES